MHLVLVLQQVVLKKITLNFITQYCVVTFTCNNFARKLLIRSLVSILHNLFSIYRTAYFILSTISDQNKKPVFWGKKFWYLRRLSLFTCGLGFISCPTIRSIYLFLISWYTKTLNTCSLQSRFVKSWCRTPDLWHLNTYNECNASNFLPIK